MSISARCAVLSVFTLFLSLPAAAEERDYDFPAFDKIDVSAGIKLTAKAGEPQRVIVKTKNGDFSDLDIEVLDGKLTISREWNRLRWHGKKADYHVTVMVDSLHGIKASSGSNAKIKNLDSREFDIDISSGAYASISGQSDDCIIDLSSGANLEAEELFCDSVMVDVSSGGRGAVSAHEKVVGDASSGGHVAIYGAPSLVKIDRSSGGRIIVVKSKAQAHRE